MAVNPFSSPLLVWGAFGGTLGAALEPGRWSRNGTAVQDSVETCLLKKFFRIWQVIIQRCVMVAPFALQTGPDMGKQISQFPLSQTPA